MKLAHQLVGLLALSSPGFSQRTEDVQLLPQDAPHSEQPYAEVGRAVACDGEWIAVSGISFHSLSNGMTGSIAFIYRDVGNGPELFQTIREPSDPGYGYSLAIDGDTLVLGSWRWGWPRKGMGRVVIYEWDGVSWIRAQVLHADGLADSVYPDFGTSVAVSGDVLVVGIPGVDRPFENAGEARIYERQSGTWGLVKRISGRPGPKARRHESWVLGYRVAADGDTVAVSAPGGSDGTVLVLERTAGHWQTSERIEAPDGMGGSSYGSGLAVSGTTLVVGEPAFSESRRGKAHVYTRNGSGAWALEQTLQPSDGYSNADYGDAFGISVAVDGDLIAVGAWNGRPYGWRTGCGYLFRRTSLGWPATEDEQLAASDPPDWDVLGCSTAISEGIVVLGTRYGLTNGVATGKAYAFHR